MHFKDYPFQLPHAFIAGMYEQFPAVFNHFIKGVRPLSEFWDSVRSTDPRLLCHPMQSTPQYKNNAVPMRIHVDAVPIGRGKNTSMKIVSISSMTGEPGCTWLTKLLLFVMTSTAVVKNSVGKTWDRAWKILIWSFEAMAKNKWPTHDWNDEAFPADSWEGERAGSTLCGEYTFRFFQIAGDLDELCNGFRLRHFNSTRNP